MRKVHIYILIRHIATERYKTLCDTTIVVSAWLIVSIKRSKPGPYRVDVYTEYAQPLTSYSDVKAVWLNEKPLGDFEEIHVEALLVKYSKEKGEVYIYTRTA